MNFAADGACLHGGLAAPYLSQLTKLFPDRGESAGARLPNLGPLGEVFAAEGPIGSLAAALIGHTARPVRAIAFDKNDKQDWSLGWHQDRTICVRERAEVHGFGLWSIKQGMTHVVPPFDMLSRMVTMRIHLDQVDEANGPLRIARGSHRLGKVAERDINVAAGQAEEYVCLAEQGDVWLYSTPILHASDKTSGSGKRRRVLQVDYCADPLPRPLEWALAC